MSEFSQLREEKNRLSSSSALVLRWDEKASHTSRESQQYLNLLDLSAADEIAEKCMGIWPHYAQNIKNRKFVILHEIEQVLAVDTSLLQVIILAAGYDALSIELASRHPALRIFDADLENMITKHACIQKIAPNLARSIRCLEVNIADPVILRATLLQAGWDPNQASLVVIEGVSYYLPERVLQDVLLMLRESGAKYFVFEHLLEFHLVNENRRKIPENMFATLADQYSLPEISCYSPDKVKVLADHLRCTIKNYQFMNEIEKNRTGHNEFYPNQDSGWIVVAHLVAT